MPDGVASGGSGRPLDPELARAHASTPPGRWLRALRLPLLGPVGAGMVVYGVRRSER